MKLVRTTTKLIAALACGLALQGGALAKADPEKVLRIAFEQADNGFDIQRVSSLYSTWVCEAIFETLLTYDYLAQPAKLVPGVVEAMPDVSDDGKTYTFRIRKGILFSDDPAFKGKRRELVANDVAYTLKRIMDPKNRAPQAGSFEGKIVGMDALVEAAKKSGKFDYDAPLAGLETPDRYTLRLRLTEPDPTMLHLLANSHTGIAAREVVEYYGDNVGHHPVGTGAYVLKEYVPGSKTILEANPDYRGFVWDFKSSGDPLDDRIVKEMKGKQMPQIGRVEVHIIEDDQARWLAFDSGQVDLAELSDIASPKVLDNGKLKPEFEKKGIKLQHSIAPAISYTFFNMRDPVVGGYSLEKNALRRAIAMSYRIQDEIRQVRLGQALKAQSLIPPGVIGYDPAYRTSTGYDPELAIKLLDRFGYRKGADGYRTTPDGKPLTVRIQSAPTTREKAIMEIWKKSLDHIGIRAEFPVATFAENLKAAYRCELTMWGLGGMASVPDGMDFLDSYYGPSAARGANRNCYESAAYDEMFRKVRVMPDGPERHALYTKMVRQIEADTAIVLHLWRYRNWLSQGRVLGYKKNPFIWSDWRYLDVEKK